MGIFERFKRKDMNSGVEQWRSTPGAVLLDVRNADEYEAGHVPGSINVPVGEIGNVTSRIPDKATPVFSYCLAGTRSERAVAEMTRMGYQNVQNIGGIRDYSGEIVSGKEG